MANEPERRPWPLRFYDAEIAPAIAGLTPGMALVGLAGGALLANKRYLADSVIVPLAENRWQALGAWLLATLVVVALAGRVRDTATRAGLATGLGLLVLLVAEAPYGWGLGQLKLHLPLTVETFGMMALAWLVAAPAAGSVVDAQRRPRAALALGLAALALVLVMLLSHRGPLAPLLNDRHYDKANWGILTCGWLLVLPLVTSWGTLGGTFAEDGGGLGRWRFWVPWVAVMLGVMVVLIVGFAGKQPSFTTYYPMFKQDWFDYQPARHGWGFFFVYELTYGLYFLAWEFFFRGWMLFRLDRELGSRAILVQCLPFVLMHIGKPPLEFHSSLVAGVALGWLAWRSRSFWPCFLIHFGAAFTMDVTALLHTSLGARP